jgi:gluconolactonase
MTRLPIAVAASLLAGSLAFAQSPPPSVVRLDPALDALVSPDARVERVKGGFGFTEGPVWVRRATRAICCSPTFRATWCGS